MRSRSALERFLDDNGFTRAELAAALKLDPSAVSRKVLGDRDWRLDEVEALRAYVSKKLGRRVSWDDLLDRSPTPGAAA